MFINEKLQIEEYNYPLYRKNNPIFKSIIENEEKIDHSDCKSEMTKWDLHFKYKEISDFINWVIGITEDTMIRPYNGYFSLMCVNSWGLICNKGNYVEEHRHERSNFSFVYYINSPKGSSPLVFELILGSTFLFENLLFLLEADSVFFPNKCKVLSK